MTVFKKQTRADAASTVAQKPEKKKYPLTAYTPAEILALPEPEWLIDELLIERSLFTVVGTSQAYKSFVALDWSLHIAYGLPWCERPVRPGKVVYVAAEGSGGQRKRIEAWFKAHPDCNPDAGTFLGVQQAVNLTDEESCEQLHQTIRTWSPNGVTLITFDTLARSMHGDENSVEAMNLVISAADEFQRRHHSAVGFMHHTGHKHKTRGRGSSSLHGAIDTEFLLQRNGTALETTLTMQKQKDFELSSAVLLHLTEIELPPTAKGKPRKSLVLTGKTGKPHTTTRDPDAKQARIAAYRAKHPDASTRDIEAALGISRTMVWRYWKTTTPGTKTTKKSVSTRPSR